MFFNETENARELKVITIGEVTFVVVVQIIIILVVLSAFLLFLLRTKNNKLKTLQLAIREREKEVKDISPLASVEYYITAELKLAESRFEMLFKEEDLLKPEFGEADWIALRKSFLEVEKALLANNNRMDSFWLFIGDKIRKLLKENHLVKRISVKEVDEEDEDDAREMKKLLKSQYDDFDSLSFELEGQKSEEEVKELKTKLVKIIRNHTELSHCVHMLESENLFLRDQIQGLVGE